jgi:hypothetical protein
VLEGPSATNLLGILFSLFCRFIPFYKKKKIKILNVGNFAVVGDIFYVA